MKPKLDQDMAKCVVNLRQVKKKLRIFKILRQLRFEEVSHSSRWGRLACLVLLLSSTVEPVYSSPVLSGQFSKS